MKFPYGISDFYKLITEDYFYVDRTDRIPIVEAMGDQLLFLLSGDLGPVCAFVEQRYFQVFDNRDYRWANELTVKTVFLTLLFNDIAYIMDSQPALAQAYADLSMIVRPEMRQHVLPDLLFEFKYVALTAEQARGLTAEDLHALPLVTSRLAEAAGRLAGYRAALQARYDDRLRLRSYAVVSLGFERLLWEPCP